MSRSPLAYPLSRSVDGDAGGAADLQTDIMRFMAILALCLVAIFALVQSIPLAPKPVPAAKPPVQAPAEEPVAVKPPEAEPIVEPSPEDARPVQLTRPQWKPLPRPERAEPATPPAALPEPVAKQPEPHRGSGN